MTRKIDSAAMAATFASENASELATRYDQWAATYDTENAAAGFRVPYLCSGFFSRHVPKESSPVLDAGCGTGLAGDCLRVLGYRDLVGIDLSETMLARAAQLSIYSELRCMTLGEQLDFPPSYFAAVISSGVFTEGHAPHSSFDELIRITRPGGCLVFNVREDVYLERGFRERQDQLEADGFWRLRERSDPFRSFVLKEPHVFASVFTYQKI